MTDRHTKFLLWAISIGVWANVIAQSTYGERNARLIRILDNIDFNIASGNNKAQKTLDSIDGRLALRP